jgi:lipopolysaccharide/colanic/teichoic acid biosynthesis glycosyltransferase
MEGGEPNLSQSEPPAKGLPLWKRALDFAIILFLSPGLILIGAVVALVVKCGSRGPVFFRQQRVGYRGRRFTLLKFRTMRANADTQSHREHTQQLIAAGVPMTKLDAHNDPRLVPLGAFLRACGLDELPQLLNVLRGEMSIIGPRPCLPYEYELYETRDRLRLSAVPGLTGLWQVSGKNRTTFGQMVELDIEYARRSSLGLDLQILLKTFPALWRQCADMRSSKRKPARSPEAHMGKSAQLNHL